MRHRTDNVQATCVGVRCVLRYRKALLQTMAAPFLPIGCYGLDMLDWVRGAGGPAFHAMLGSLRNDAGALPDLLRVLTMGTASAPPTACELYRLPCPCMCVYTFCLPSSVHVTACVLVKLARPRLVRCCNRGSNVEQSVKPVLLPRYKKVRQRGGADVEHGKCAVLVSWTESEAVMCNRPVVGGAGHRWHVCSEHIHAPAILLETGSCDGAGQYVRFCHHGSHKCMLPLDRFFGLSGVCKDHRKGRQRAGFDPVAPPQPPAAQAVVEAPVQLRTLRLGHDRLLYRTLPCKCDAVGCEEPPHPPTLLCGHHRQV